MKNLRDILEGFFNNVQSMKMDIVSFRNCMKPYQAKDEWNSEDDEKVKAYLTLLLSQMENGQVLQYETGYGGAHARIKKTGPDTFETGRRYMYSLDDIVSYIFEDIWEMCDNVMDTIRLK